jgi:threonyl-tRNA synthetase
MLASFPCLLRFLYRKRILEANEPFKLEILDSILSKQGTDDLKNKQDVITIYHIGKEWWDLCAGPHVESTGKISSNAIELQSLSGAYWRGDEANPMLQVRISFVSVPFMITHRSLTFAFRTAAPIQFSLLSYLETLWYCLGK